MGRAFRIAERGVRHTGRDAAHALLYGNPGVCRDVVDGDNKDSGIGYAAGPGWDACTGLGSPDGARLLRLFRQAAAQS